MDGHDRYSIASFLNRFMLKPALRERASLVTVCLSLLFLSVTQALILFLIKGFLAAFFTDTRATTIALLDLVPRNFGRYLPRLADIRWSREMLVTIVPVGIIIAGITKAFASYLYTKGISRLSLKVAQNYREKIFEGIVSLPWISLSKRGSGEWMTVIMSDALFIQNRLSDFSTAFIKDAVLILTCVVTLAFIHWQAAVFLLAISPVIGWKMGQAGKRISWYTEAFQRELGKLAGRLLGIRERFRFMRAQRGEAFEEAQFARGNDAYLSMMTKSIFLRSLIAPGMEFVGFAIFAVFIYGWSRNLPGFQMSPDVVIQFFVALGLILRPVREMGEQVARWSETVGGLRRSMDVISEVESRQGNSSELRVNNQAVSHAQAPSRAQIGKFGLDIRELEIAYDQEVKLRAENLSVRSGHAIAIIGPSGAGKSTIFKVLSGLLRPKVWDANIPIDEVVDHCSLVSQNPFLFHDTLRRNLLYGLPREILGTVTDEMLWGALNVVNLAAAIKSMPHGLESFFNPLDTNLSGGQIQRLVIARAILRRPLVLLLDEATSALDGATEEDITRRLVETVRETGTVLISVTHRLRWLEMYDEIWFIEQGELRFKGTFDELSANPRFIKYISTHNGEMV